MQPRRAAAVILLASLIASPEVAWAQSRRVEARSTNILPLVAGAVAGSVAMGLIFPVVAPVLGVESLIEAELLGRPILALIGAGGGAIIGATWMH